MQSPVVVPSPSKPGKFMCQHNNNNNSEEEDDVQVFLLLIFQNLGLRQNRLFGQDAGEETRGIDYV